VNTAFVDRSDLQWVINFQFFNSARRLHARGLYPDNLKDKTLAEMRYHTDVSLSKKAKTYKKILLFVTEYRPSVTNLTIEKKASHRLSTIP